MIHLFAEAGRAELRRGQSAMARARLGRMLGEPDSEAIARRALGHFAAAMNYLEDTPDFEVAHFWLDESGRWVREAFGCWLSQERKSYSRTCPADLGHIRMGMSPGMRNIVRVCGVCGREPRLCDHIRGRMYSAPRLVVLGACNLCGRAECDHDDGEIGEVMCQHTITSADLDEISLVRRPAQPLARLTSIGVDPAEMRERLGPTWQPGMAVSCDKCLSKCRGVREASLSKTQGGPT